MKFTRLARLGLLALGIILVAGCASTYSQSTSPTARINANRALFESWPMNIQNAILDRTIEKGMTPEMVVMALGKPTRVTPVFDRPGEELWIYGTESSPDDYQPSMASGSSLSIGGANGIGATIPMSGITGTADTPASDDYREITFKDGAVEKSN